MPLRSAQQIHITENTVISHEILIFQITGNTPLIHLDQNLILPFFQCNRKFRGRMGNSRISHITAIYKQFHARRYPFKYQRIFSCSFLCRHGKKSSVYTQRVIIRHIRRIYRIRIIYIRIIRFFITSHLPAGRHRNLVPLCNLFRTVNISCKIPEIPLAIQQLIICRSRLIPFQGFFQRIIRNIMSSWRERILMNPC